MSNMPAPAASKAELRSAVLARLRSLSPQQVADYSARLRQLLTAQLGTARHICLYAPLAHEVDLLPLLTERSERSYYFPRCLPGRQLRFHRVSHPETELQPGAMGILAPAEHLPALAPEDIDLIIVPGVAFTPSGLRLGYGGGYYDRFLPLCPRARKVALAFPEQMLTDLPTDEHDCTIPCVLSL